MTTPAPEAKPSPYNHQTVLWVKHWTDRLFSFAISRPASLRFRSGEFIMIGLALEPKPILRAYSIASPGFADEIEFLSIKVPDGPLTSHLLNIQPGDEVLMGKKPTGTLVLDALKGGKRLFLMTPIHHHFQQKGWPATKVVARFWILSLLCGLLGLLSLKLR